jgi:sugar phosphate isomerase/epimerase
MAAVHRPHGFLWVQRHRVTVDGGAGPEGYITMAKIPVAVQLYSVRDLTAKDFAGTVKEIARIGYAGVELAGFGNLKTPQEAKKALDDAGLKVCGNHVGFESLESNLNAVLDGNEILGNKMIVCPSLPEARRKDAAGWKQVAASLNNIGAACQKRGFELAYHNHAFEFARFEGQTGMDILFGNTDPNLVKAELDLFWVKFADVDPAAYTKQLGKRVALLHMKDMAAGAEKKFAPVGTGIVDFRAVLTAAAQLPIKAYIVEQDNTYGQPPMQAVATSFANLKKLGVA